MKNVKIIVVCVSFLVLFSVFNAPAGATSYLPGYVWDRKTDYSTAANPNNDQNGSKVWSYEWFTYENYPASSRINIVAPWGPRWGNGAVNISGWDQNTNYGFQNPLHQSALIRWIDPVAGDAVIDFDGSLTMYWGGTNDGQRTFTSTPVDVRFIMGIYDSSANQVNLLVDNIITSSFTGERNAGSNFGNCPKIVIPIDYSILMNTGDSYFWSAIPL